MDKEIYTKQNSDGIAFAVINKPQRKNAISGIMMEELSQVLWELDGDERVRVIILRGEGDNFSAGGDLKQAGPEGLTIEASRKLLQKYIRCVKTIQEIGTPVIAMVDGYAVGGAMSLALACDLICVSERVKFVPNFVQVGIIPEMGSMLFLPQLLGPQRAKELFFTGRTIGAEEGYALGFVNRIFPAAELEEGTIALAREIAAQSSVSVQITKKIINSTMGPLLDLVTGAELTASPFCTQTVEYKERLARFTKK